MTFAVSALLGGCASTVQRGADFYMQRRYIDAAQVFEHCESQLSDWKDAERAEYALYRGATFLALGDREGARQWLSGAQRGWAHLSDTDRALLTNSLRSIGGAPGQQQAPDPALLQTGTGLAVVPARLGR